MLPAAFLAPVIHEWVKAMVSTAQGDPAPRKHGFLTANPFKYFEPIGFMFILLFGFGWGRPVPTTALHYRNRQRGVLVTYTIPVLVNLLLGVVAIVGVSILASGMAFPAHINERHFNTFFLFIANWYWRPDSSYVVANMLAHFAFININLALFNLIPVYPLAANKLLLTFSNPDTIAKLNHYEKPMQIILIILLAFGGFGLGGSGGIIPRVILPITSRIIAVFWGITF